MTVNVSVPLFVLVGILVYVAWRYMGLRLWHLFACILLGVLLAATSFGPEITRILDGLFHWLTKS